MILQIARKRILISLKSGRLLMVSASMLALMSLLGVNAARRHSEKTELWKSARDSHRYAVEDSRSYMQIRLGLEKPPEPLGFFASGLTDSYGSSALVSGKYGPIQLRARESIDASAGEELSLDFSHMIAVFLGLLALIVTYDAVSGEREEGTLQLSLSNPVSRATLLWGEFLGAMLALSAPLAMATLATLATLRFSTAGDLTGAMLVRVGILSVAALAMLSALAWFGLLCSSMARDSSTAFILAFTFWTLTTLVYPRATLWCAQAYRPVPASAGTLDAGGVFQLGAARPAERPTPDQPADSSTASLNAKLGQAGLAARVDLFSPVSCFLEVSRIAAETDVGAQESFLALARSLDRDLRAWQTEKLAKYPERESFYRPSWGPLDRDGLPFAVPLQDSWQTTLARSAPYFGSLIVFNAIFSLLATGAFATYDIRFR